MKICMAFGENNDGDSHGLNNEIKERNDMCVLAEAVDGDGHGGRRVAIQIPSIFKEKEQTNQGK